MRGLKVLLAAVIVMGVMIVLGTAVLISTVIRRATHRPPAATAMVPSAVPVDEGVALRLALDQPPGTRITSVTRQSDTLLAVALTGGGGSDRLLICDIATGRIVARVTLDR